MSKAFALLAADLGYSFGTICVSQALPGVIPEHKALGSPLPQITNNPLLHFSADTISKGYILSLCGVSI